MNEGVAGEFARGRDQHCLPSDREFKPRDDLPYRLPARDNVEIVTEQKRLRGWVSWLDEWDIHFRLRCRAGIRLTEWSGGRVDSFFVCQGQFRLLGAVRESRQDETIIALILW